MDASNRRQRGLRVLTTLLGVLVGFGVGAGWATFAEEAADRSSTSTLPVRSSSKTSPSSHDAQADRKLDQLLAGQQTMLQRFDAVLEELRVVKIRCSN